MTTTGAERKRALRADLTAARRRLTGAERASAGNLLVATLASCAEVTDARVLACYQPVGTEPDIGELLATLHAGGRTVLLPVLLADNDLDWAGYDGEFATGRHGLAEPPAAPLGREAVRDAEVVIVPGLAVDRAGRRLGRGGGSYDRALARLAPGAWTVTPLYRGELLDEVPVEEHDRRVHAAATPDGVHRLRAT